MTNVTKYMIALTGHIGSGKSTAAYYIASQLSAFLMISDKYRRGLIKKYGMSQEQGNISLDIKQEIKKIWEEEISSRNNKHIVVDSCLTLWKDRNLLRKIAKINNYTILFIQITSQEKLIQKRIQNRKIDNVYQFSGGTFEGYLKQREMYELFDEDDCILIENNGTKKELYASIDKKFLNGFVD